MDHGSAPHPNAAIILIGDELLSGKVHDRNGPFLLRELRALGVQVSELHIVADDTARIAECVTLVHPRNDLVFTSGGVGPTHDDLTLTGVARAFNVPLVELPPLIAMIDALEPDPDAARAWYKVARVPQGCELVYHGHTRWPCYKMRNVYLLPGVPRYCQRHFEGLRPQLQAIGAPFHLITLHLNLGEGALAPPLLEASQRWPRVAIGSYPQTDDADDAPFQVRVTLESRDADAVRAAHAWLLSRVDPAAIIAVDPDDDPPRG